MKYCIACMMPVADETAFCPYCGKNQDQSIPAHHLLPGTVLSGKYAVGAALGEGGFGITYIGRDLRLEMKVAIKEYYPNGYASRSNSISPDIQRSTSQDRKEFFDRGRERFLDEARVLAKFSGEPGIVDVRDFFEENGTAYIVMEFLDGETLLDYIQKRGPLAPDQAVSMLTPLMQSLQKVHRQGLIHRDISPDNIMLTGGSVKLLDFGAARNVSAAANKSLSVMLKPGYAPEEQYRSRGSQGPWTDVYALCATIYKCVTGVTPDDAAQRVYSDELKAPSALGVAISPVTEAALMKGLAVFQRDRYQSIDELLDGFNGVQPKADGDSKTVPIPQGPVQDGFGGSSSVAAPGPAPAADPNLTVPGGGYSQSSDVTVPGGNYGQDANVTVPGADYSQGSGRKTWNNGGNQPVPKVQNVQNIQSGQAAPPPKPQKAPKKKINAKKLAAYGLAGLVGVVVIVFAVVLFRSMGEIVICGKKYSREEESISVFDKTVTQEDAKALKALGKINYLSFNLCVFEEGAMATLGEMSANLNNLSLYNCTGDLDYTIVSKQKYIETLNIENCGLTNSQLAGMDLSEKVYLRYVSLSNNSELSDLSPLADLQLTLSSLYVSGTGIKDFTPLKDCIQLNSIRANDCGLTDLSSLTNPTIQILYVSNNQLTDLSFVKNFPGLSYFKASNNQISDISPLADCLALYDLELNNNQISDLSPLSEHQLLTFVQLANNQIETLESFAKFEKLNTLDVTGNRLTNLDGLEHCLNLTFFYADDNRLENIDGLTNATVLEMVELTNNKLTDLSLLAKSAATLTRLHFSDNQVADISFLENATELYIVSFDRNQVTSLEPLRSSVKLMGLSAEENRLTSTDGVENLVNIEYLCLTGNQIADMTAFGDLLPKMEDGIAVVDLSHNQITDLYLPPRPAGDTMKQATYFSIYDNPFTSYENLVNFQGSYILFTHIEDTDYGALKDQFNYFTIVDSPLDQQVAIKTAIAGQWVNFTVYFATMEEADANVAKQKANIFGTSGGTMGEGMDADEAAEEEDGSEENGGQEDGGEAEPDIAFDGESGEDPSAEDAEPQDISAAA